MRRILLALLLVAVSATYADARRHHRHWRHHHHERHVSERESPAAPPPASADLPPAIAAAPPPNSDSEPTYGDPDELVPPDWKLAPPDPNWTGRRFFSPDGQAWAAAYARRADQESVDAHLKAVAFVDGEDITYLRGGRGWIVVSGLKGDRIFYRKAVLACAGKSWHQIAFEYPRQKKRALDSFVSRAAAALDHTANEGCDSVAARR